MPREWRIMMQQPQRGDITQHSPDGLCLNTTTITPWINREEKNFSVNFVFCEVCSIFAVCYGNSRAQDILHNLLKAVWITTSEHNEQNSSSIESKHFQCRLSHIELWLVVSQDYVWRGSALFFFMVRRSPLKKLIALTIKKNLWKKSSTIQR